MTASLDGSVRTGSGSLRALWPLDHAKNATLDVGPPGAPGDLSGLLKDALERPGDYLVGAAAPGGLLCGACVVAPTGGNLAISVEALDLDDQACETAARLTDEATGVPGAAPRLFLRLRVASSAGGSHAVSSTSLVGSRAWGPCAAPPEKLRVRVAAADFAAARGPPPRLELAVIDERGRWRNRWALGTIDLSPLATRGPDGLARVTKGVRMSLNDPATGADRGTATLTATFEASGPATDDGGRRAAPTAAACAAVRDRSAGSRFKMDGQPWDSDAAKKKEPSRASGFPARAQVRRLKRVFADVSKNKSQTARKTDLMGALDAQPRAVEAVFGRSRVAYRRPSGHLV